MLSNKAEILIVIGLLCSLGVLLAWSAAVHSPTVDEPAHLAAGLCYWEHGTFDLYNVNPPLVRLIGSLPVLVRRPHLDWSMYRIEAKTKNRVEFAVGKDYVRANGPTTLWDVTLARWVCLPFALLGGYVSYRWSRELWGMAGGLLTLTLWCVFPEVLAHGALFTCDMAAASAGIALLYQFRRWLMLPDRLQTMTTGILLGFALLTKFTWLLMFGILPVCWGLSRLFQRPRLPGRMWFKEGMQLVALLLIGLAVLNLGYGCDGSFRRLGDFDFYSRSLSLRTTEDDDPGNRFRGSWLGEIPVPFPRDYVLGCDLQRYDLEWPRIGSDARAPAPEHQWNYYLLGLATKVPGGIWILLGIALAGIGRIRPPVVDLLPLAVTIGVLLWTLSSNLGFTAFRYALPMFPPLLILCGGAAATWLTSGLYRRVAVTSMAAWCAVSSLSVVPHSFAYFNELAGGPFQGHRWLSASGVDWGQDLLFLRTWMRDHPEARPFYLRFNNFYNAADVGINYDCCPTSADRTRRNIPGSDLVPGWYAISVTLFENRIVAVPMRQCLNPNCGAWNSLKARQLVGRAGYSILIYHVPEPDALEPESIR